MCMRDRTSGACCVALCGGLMLWCRCVLSFKMGGRCVLSFKMGFWVCGSRGVRVVHVFICKCVVQIGVTLLEVPWHILFQRRIRVKIRQVAALHSSLALSASLAACRAAAARSLPAARPGRCASQQPRSLGIPGGLLSGSST